MLERVLEPEAMADPREALAYDRMDHSAPNEAFVDRLVELDAHGRMLDVGVGPGHIPLMVCDRLAHGRIVGIDLSESMLRIARQHCRRSAHADRIVYQVADAKSLPFADESFDTVFSNSILHHLADPAAALVEAWRVLKPGGAFLFRDLFRPPDAATRRRLVETHAAGQYDYQKQLFRQSLDAALTPDELRRMIGRFDWADQVRVLVDTDRHVSVQRPGAA